MKCDTILRLKKKNAERQVVWKLHAMTIKVYSLFRAKMCVFNIFLLQFKMKTCIRRNILTCFLSYFFKFRLLGQPAIHFLL